MRIVDFPAARHAEVRGFRAEAERARLAGNQQAQREILADANVWDLAELYWVTPEMTALAVDAAYDMPDWSVEALLPADVGVLFFDGGLPPLPFVDLEDEYVPLNALGQRVYPQVTVDWVRWRRTGTDLSIDFGCLRHRAVFRDYQFSAPFIQMGGVEGTTLATVLPRVKGGPIDPAKVWKVDVVLLVGAVWALMGQETAATTHRKMHEPGKLERRRGVPPTMVTTVSLRRLRSVDESPVDGSGRKYTHRWIVRGHWRQQAVGAGRELRRPTWIPSYIKGPEGAPLIATEKVNVWRR